MTATRFLTGITTSGTPHLGNYVGSIRPSVRASLAANVESFYFLADYHALIKTEDPARVQRSTLEIAASWLASGLNPERVTFYRQSDIPEIPELCWFLTCVTGKGVLNRAHAYKAAVDKNQAAGQDPDADVNAGLFMYPVLMGADILMFNAQHVPVGRDQVQHIEMARDMANSFNHRYGAHFVLPQAAIEESVATLPGLDGRKMSKSYDNTIPLFSSKDQLRKLIAGIVTDSRPPGEAKDTEGSALFQIYQAFATAEETQAFKAAFADGIAWGDAKHALLERIDQEMAPMRASYEDLISAPERIEQVLLNGAEKARAIASPFMADLRHAVGLRKLHANAKPSKAKSEKVARASFKQYREKDGLFYFKFVAADGEVLMQSMGFESPKIAGQSIALLQQGGGTALAQVATQLAPWTSAAQEQRATAALDQWAQEASAA
ncbi:tryptophan--tRNA ligase [Rhodoferax aquaticus]|uniref:Tryptophan--tRNA ligase n=1 Tax=Rhodoferax aquaticus TaxID=2527691 RepID=A0A515ESF9_9BURK|nr:tryptophan--tRNA ligase [Rhodoferax aquaticus]QDL55602.1 tryptophan--tRNA ligase [Rhodoferax aquaticus]